MPKRTKHVLFPETQNPFLNDVITSFRKRAKAIRHAGINIIIQKVIDRTPEEDIEKIEVQLKSCLGPQVGLSLWSDRWIFVHAGHLTKQGWLWEWTKEGRVIGPEAERIISHNSERMLEAGLGFNKPKEYCDRLWQGSIATGPSSVG